MYRYSGFFLFVVSIAFLLGGGWLIWGSLGALTPAKTLPAPTFSPLWLSLQLVAGLLLGGIAARVFYAGWQLLQEKDHMLFFLPAEAWSLLWGVAAAGVLLFLLLTGDWFSGARPKQCTFRQPSGNPISGPEWSCFPDGTWALAGQWSQGKRHGLWVRWHANGKRAWEGTYVFGKKHGKFSKYNKFGRQISFFRYDNDVLDGQFLRRYNRGAFTPPKIQGQYNKGKKCGQWSYWVVFLQSGLLQRKMVKSIKYPPCE